MGQLKNVIVEMNYSPDLHHAALAARQGRSPMAGLTMLPAGVESAPPDIPGFRLDTEFGVAQVPRETVSATAAVEPRELRATLAPEQSSYFVRGVIDEDQIEDSSAAAESSGARIWADPVIEPCLICPGSPPLGTAATVAQLLCVPSLASHRMDGSGVMIAVVDTGFNLAYLRGHGRSP